MAIVCVMANSENVVILRYNFSPSDCHFSLLPGPSSNPVWVIIFADQQTNSRLAYHFYSLR